MTPDTTIISANLGPRFQGRATLVRAAEQGNVTALALLQMTAAKRLISAVKGEMSRDFIKALGLTNELNRINSLRAARRKTQIVKDAILNRQPNNVAKRTVLTVFRAALKKANFRTASHSHSLKITYVPVGQEHTFSNTSKEWPSNVGLPKAYRYKVTTSQHIFSVSIAFLKVPPARRAGQGWIQLTPEIRIVQSRGTSFRTERKTEKIAA